MDGVCERVKLVEDGALFFRFEIMHDEVLTVGGILTHVEVKKLFDVVLFLHHHGIEAHIFADEGLELLCLYPPSPLNRVTEQPLPSLAIAASRSFSS